MDTAFDPQYLTIKEAFARRNVDINVAYTPAGEVDYVYQVGRLLALDREDNIARLTELLPGIRRPPEEQPESDLAVLSIEDLEDVRLTSPEALDLLDERLGEDNPALREDGLPLATPVYVMHITRICPAVEPEVPGGDPAQPWPLPCQPSQSKRDVKLFASDTGLLANVGHPWLAGVTGDPDDLDPPGLSGLPRIPQFAGHGTFIAGVARCMAPRTEVFVNDHFTASGGELEYVIIEKLEQLAKQSPDIINLSAGTYCRRNWTSLGFESFRQRHPEITLVAAAGNDSTNRKFYPAALPWTISVGALGTDQQHRAWFSNYGDWVDVYALGEGIVNAYAVGEYVYHEPPKRPAVQTFNGMARWGGTSFSAPLVAGLIAARMSRTGESSDVAAQAVLEAARNQPIAGVGPALYPLCDQP
jgi:hypothetical protein